jgi:hypothetical protein
MNQDLQNIPNSTQVNLQNPSEPIAMRSEEMQNHSEPESESFRIVPNGSEEVRNETHNIPNHSEEPYRTAASCSDDNTEHTITVREAARIFEEAGIPRTERALTNWCNKNTRGVTRLDCCYRESQRRYYITPQSIDAAIKEEREKALHRGVQNATLFSAEAEQLSDRVQNEVHNGSEEMRNRSEQESESFRTVPNSSEEVRNETKNVPNRSAGDTDSFTSGHEKKSRISDTDEPVDKKEKDALKELQIENYELKVQLEGQKHLIRKFDELVDGERGRHEKEKLALVDRLTDARYQVGSLEEKLLQLEAPKGEIATAEVTEVRNL